jgi:hypothetical protein
LNVLRAYIEQQRRPHDAIHLRPEGRSPLAKAWYQFPSWNPAAALKKKHGIWVAQLEVMLNSCQALVRSSVV